MKKGEHYDKNTKKEANFSRCGFDRQPFIFACFKKKKIVKVKVYMFVETKVGQESNVWFFTQLWFSETRTQDET